MRRCESTEEEAAPTVLEEELPAAAAADAANGGEDVLEAVEADECACRRDEDAAAPCCSGE